MISINLQDIQFMLNTLALSEEYKEKLNDLTSDKDKVIPDDFADALRDLCSDRLDTHAFDANYDPTDEGKKLEALIDKLYIG